MLIPCHKDIAMRPNEKCFGDYEADMALGTRPNQSVLAVFVERNSRFYRIIKMPKMEISQANI